MKKEHLITTISIIILWLFLAIKINNDIIMPNPINVFQVMIDLFFSSYFYMAIIFTVKRVMIGLFFSLSLSILIACFSSVSNKFKRLFEPINIMAKTIPNISYIIIILIWFGSEISVSIVTFLILFPMFYSHLLLSLNKINDETKKLLTVYKISNKEKLFKIYFPMIFPDIINELKLGFSLGFKVSIMAEILGQVKFGLGKLLYIAKIDLDMSMIFALTIYIIAISVVIERLFTWIYAYIKR